MRQVAICAAGLLICWSGDAFQPNAKPVPRGRAQPTVGDDGRALDTSAFASRAAAAALGVLVSVIPSGAIAGSYEDMMSDDGPSKQFKFNFETPSFDAGSVSSTPAPELKMPEPFKKMPPKPTFFDANDSPAPTPKVELPSFSAPKLPSFSAPSVSSDDDSTPAAPSFSAPKVELPSFSAPSLPAPPKVDLPSFSAPKLPSFAAPSVSSDDESTPAAPSFSAPKVELPSFAAPSVPALPSFSAPSFSAPALPGLSLGGPATDSGVSVEKELVTPEVQAERDQAAREAAAAFRAKVAQVKEIESQLEGARKNTKIADEGANVAKDAACETRFGGKWVCLRGFSSGY